MASIQTRASILILYETVSISKYESMNENNLFKEAAVNPGTFSASAKRQNH